MYLNAHSIERSLEGAVNKDSIDPVTASKQDFRQPIVMITGEYIVD